DARATPRRLQRSRGCGGRFGSPPAVRRPGRDAAQPLAGFESSASTESLAELDPVDHVGSEPAVVALGLLGVSDALVGEEGDAVIDGPAVDEAHGFLVAGLGEEPLAGSEHD